MFEYHQKIVDLLLVESDEFRELHGKHRGLDEQIEEADTGIAPIDDFTLHCMKKEKLLIRDQLATLIEERKKTQA